MLSKTLKNKDDATESGLKNNHIQILFIILLIVVGCVGYVYYNSSNKYLTLGNQKFEILLSDTPELRARGLSGRSSLGANQAMLFDFEQEGNHCIWMKDMNFAIDIVWLDSQKKVVYIEKTVRPESFPHSYCGEKSRYVVELAEGATSKVDLHTGDSVHF